MSRFSTSRKRSSPCPARTSPISRQRSLTSAEPTPADSRGKAGFSAARRAARRRSPAAVARAGTGSDFPARASTWPAGVIGFHRRERPRRHIAGVALEHRLYHFCPLPWLSRSGSSHVVLGGEGFVALAEVCRTRSGPWAAHRWSIAPMAASPRALRVRRGSTDFTSSAPACQPRRSVQTKLCVPIRTSRAWSGRSDR